MIVYYSCLEIVQILWVFFGIGIVHRIEILLFGEQLGKLESVSHETQFLSLQFHRSVKNTLEPLVRMILISKYDYRY